MSRKRKRANSPSATILDTSGPALIDIGCRKPKPVEVDSLGVIQAGSQCMQLGHISAEEADFADVEDDGPPRRPRKRRKKQHSMPANRPENIPESNFNKHYQENPLSDPVELTESVPESGSESQSPENDEDEKQQVAKTKPTPAPQPDNDDDIELDLGSDVDISRPAQPSGVSQEPHQDDQTKILEMQVPFDKTYKIYKSSTSYSR